jgi:hypothetical protein
MRIGDKVIYVRREAHKGSGGHGCHWPGCDRKVSPAFWGCIQHWRRLPLDIQRAIWRSFQPGQEKSKTPSREYVEAARAAQDWIAANYPPPPKQEGLPL